MKKILIILAGLFLFALIPTSAQKTIVIPNMVLKGDCVGVFNTDVLLNALEHATLNNKAWKLVARGKVVDALLADFDFEARGIMTDPDKVNLAQMPNIDYICVSEISPVPGVGYLVSVKIVDKKSAALLQQASRYFQSVEEFPDICSGLAFELFGEGNDDNVMSVISNL